MKISKLVAAAAVAAGAVAFAGGSASAHHLTWGHSKQCPGNDTWVSIWSAHHPGDASWGTYHGTITVNGSPTAVSIPPGGSTSVSTVLPLSTPITTFAIAGKFDKGTPDPADDVSYGGQTSRDLRKLGHGCVTTTTAAPTTAPPTVPPTVAPTTAPPTTVPGSTAPTTTSPGTTVPTTPPVTTSPSTPTVAPTTEAPTPPVDTSPGPTAPPAPEAPAPSAPAAPGAVWELPATR